MTPISTRSALKVLCEPVLLVYCLCVATLPLARPAVAYLGQQPVQIADVLMVGAYILWLISYVRGKVPLTLDCLLLSSGIFLATQGLSLVMAGNVRLVSVVKLGAFALFVLWPSLSLRVITDSARLRCLCIAWCVGAAVAVLTGLAGIIAFYADRHGLGEAMMCGYGNLHSSSSYPRLCAPFRHPNMFANYLTAAVPVGLTVLATMTRQCYVLLSLAAATLVAVFTLSTGFAGFALAIGTLMWFWLPKNRLRPLCAAGIVMATGASVIILTLATIASIVPSGEGHIPLGSRDLRLWDESRPSIWSGAVATVRAHPLTGLGYGSLVAVTADPRSFVPADKQDKLETPIEPRHMEAHNVWLSIAGQSGIVGLAAFACLLIVIVRPLWTRIKGSRDLGRHLLIAVAGAFIGAFLYNGLFAAIEEARHIWALFGLMVVVGRHSPQWEE